MSWRRHRGETSWHAGEAYVSSFVTFCYGRWSLSDEEGGEVEHSDNPPHDERCDACVRARIDVLRVDQGLRELAKVSEGQAGIHELFDLGGES